MMSPRSLGIRWFEAARLTVGDLAGADDIDCDAADLTLGRRHAQDRNGDRTVARQPRFGSDEDEVATVSGSRNVTISVPCACDQSATVAPVTLLTVTPSGVAIATSRATPSTTSMRTLAVIRVVSSPSATSSVILARVRSGSDARRSSMRRFQEKFIARPVSAVDRSSDSLSVFPTARRRNRRRRSSRSPSVARSAPRRTRPKSRGRSPSTRGRRRSRRE